MSALIPAIILDTNYLLDFPNLDLEMWGISPLEIIITETVLDELKGLCNNQNSLTAGKAHKALKELQKFQSSFAPLKDDAGIRFTFVERCSDLIPPLDNSKPDHQIIAYAIKIKTSQPYRFAAILSNDKELCDIAETLSILVVSRHNDQRFHQELTRKYEWWVITKKIAQTSQTVQLKPEKTVRNVDKKTYQKERLKKFIRRLYRRVQSIGFRSTLFLAPLEARIWLTIEIIKRNRRPDKHTVLVVVESREAAIFWAGEIRQKGDFNPQDIQIFGVDPLDRLDKAKVIVYRHDQIGRRLPQHVVRLTQADKRLIAIVDGCDLLDPVELAILLYECGQFIGLNHFPLDYKQARGHRMLSMILHNQSLIDYSFADAERDGWGNPCDPYQQRIYFTNEERMLWEENNVEYIRQRELALKKYPSLSSSEQFWDALDTLIKQAAVPEIIDLIKLREQREQMCQLAQNKLQAILQLIHSSTHKHQRCLIFDYCRQWTPVLLGQLNQIGIRIIELPQNEDQLEVWNQFAGNKYDILILSNIPNYDLSAANLHQLIIITPLRPLSEVIKMIDWTLSHNQAIEALRINTLSVSDTLEELAMQELFSASFR
jgi:rRNA-processing protein FCF1